jgi:hypothetical protein
MSFLDLDHEVWPVLRDQQLCPSCDLVLPAFRVDLNKADPARAGVQCVKWDRVHLEFVNGIRRSLC